MRACATGWDILRKRLETEADLQTSIFVARLLGPLFLLIGAAVLANEKTFRALGKEVLRSYALLYLFGVLDLAAGIALVLVHNLWVRDWRVLITVIAWIFIARGLVRIFAPDQVRKMGAKFLRKPATFQVSALASILLGAVLSYCGYAL
jgi:hypothetical protein